MRSCSWFVIGSLIAGAGCSSAVEPLITAPPMSGLEISSAYEIAASATLVHDPDARVQYVLHVTNGTDADEQVSYGACWAELRFYTTPARTGTPLYDYGAPKPGTGCTANWNETTVAPGGVADLVGYISMRELTAAGVPQGHYYVSLVVAPNGATTQIAAGEVDVQP